MADVSIKDEYWLAKPGDEGAEYIAHRQSGFHGDYAIWGTNPILQSWSRNHLNYFSSVLEPSAWETSLMFDGEQEELVRMIVPMARKLIRDIVGTANKQPLSFNPIAQSKERGVIREMRIARGLVDQVTEEQDVDIISDSLLENSLVTGLGFTKTIWNTDKGDPQVVGIERARNRSEILFKGDVEISCPTIFDVFFDYQIENWKMQGWAEVREKRNRWDLISAFPDKADYIRALPSIRNTFGQHDTSEALLMSDDYVYIYELYAKPSPALPNGRILIYGDHRTILYDGPNKYGKLPIEQSKPASVTGTGFGYPLYSDLMPLQEMYDHGISAMATNQSAFAVQSIAVPRNAGIDVNQVFNLTFLEYDAQPGIPNGGKPEPLQLTQSSPETEKFIMLCKEKMEVMSNVSGALRGTPPPGITSGTAIATITTNALEFIMQGVKVHRKTLERTMMNAVNAYKKFAGDDHVVKMVGKNNQSYDQTFSGKDLEPIQGIKMPIQNPMMMTMGGRTQIAEFLVTNGMVKDPRKYISILDGAPMEALYEIELSEEDLINNENEHLMNGEEVPVIQTDDHPAHIREHAALLNEMEIRRDPERLELIQNHILEHLDLQKQRDPELEAMLRTGMSPQTGLPPMGGPAEPAPGPEALETQESPEMVTPGVQGDTMIPENQPAQNVAEPADDLLGR